MMFGLAKPASAAPPPPPAGGPDDDTTTDDAELELAAMRPKPKPAIKVFGDASEFFLSLYFKDSM